MPGRREIKINPALCRRCQGREPAITVRTEPLCKECFCRYVSTKVVKRMETFRVRHAEPGRERKLLLPLSFGVCSAALLHTLSNHLKGQLEKTGRTGFKLHVLHLDTRAVRQGAANPSLLEITNQLYPEHVYTTETLESLFVDGGDIHSVPPVLSVQVNELAGSDNTHPADSLHRLFDHAPSATAKSDLLSILLRKLVVSSAIRQGCEAIIWGDSTTRLAERTLAETAKGRGYSLPWLVADGDSPHHVPFHYPMRELLSSEIRAFTEFVDPALGTVIHPEHPTTLSVSSKNTTIDSLMKQYFQSVEKDYPSIVANVVRTNSKLQLQALSEITSQCELCDMPLMGNAPERSRLCHGCMRTLPSTTDD